MSAQKRCALRKWVVNRDDYSYPRTFTRATRTTPS
jgi:hypothetical protein